MTRRGFLGGAAATIVVVAGGLYRFTNLFVKHYPPTPYDDVLALVADREQAAILGRHVAAFEVSRDGPALRRQLAGATLETAVVRDIVVGHVTEIDGWLVPQTVAQLSALAAKV